MSDKSSRQSEKTRITSVSRDDFTLALDVLETAFPDLSRTFFHSIIMRDPDYEPAYGLAIQQGDLYLSFLQVFKRSLLLREQPMMFGGVGGVGTRPECRSRGYAAALLKRAAGLMGRDGMAGSFLFTTIHPFYERLGWRIIRQTEQDQAIEPLTQNHFSLDWIRPIREEDYQCMDAIYKHMQRRMGGGIIRSIQYWKSRASWLTHFPVIVIDGNRIVGYFYYAQFDLKKPVMTVSEYGFVEEEEWVVERMLRCIARKAEELGCKTIRGFFQQDPVMNGYCESRDFFQTGRDFRYLMWKDLNDNELSDVLQDHADQKRLLFWTTDAF
ncbi:MAG: GNAT family N-acetyltransferase [Candidatus Omnitrophica bacterium]|nr:GNAT family N-acetyltransferase [Candidatus Omnitrophota bacterium]